MASICYYISGHGFGHATRSGQVISALMSSPITSTITISTTAPRHLFPHSPRISYRSRVLDSAIIQPLPYEIDVEASLQQLENFTHNLYNARNAEETWIEEETRFLDEKEFDVLISDAPWAIGLLKPRNKPIKILLTNFTFDLIFSSLATRHLPPATSLQTKDKYLTVVNEHVKDAYTSFDYLLRLPGYIEFPFLSHPKCVTKTIDTPLVYRPPKGSWKEEILRDLDLPLPLEFLRYKILLMQFGGHAATASEEPPQLPDNWVCFTTGSSSEKEGSAANAKPGNKFFTFPPDTYLPDIINICDAVLGKIGYGTVSECVGMGKPLLYVRREMFAEEPGLLKYLEEEGVGLEIGREEFESGNWKERIEELEALNARKGAMWKGDGSEEVARIIEGLCVGDE